MITLAASVGQMDLNPVLVIMFTIYHITQLSGGELNEWELYGLGVTRRITPQSLLPFILVTSTFCI